MVSLEVIEKRGGAVNKIPASNEISLTEASVVRIELPRSQVRSMRRAGDDLLITTASGEVVTIHGFFAPYAGREKSDLVLLDEDGGKWFANLGDAQQGELAVGYSGIDSVEPLLLQQGRRSPAAAAVATAPARCNSRRRARATPRRPRSPRYGPPTAAPSPAWPSPARWSPSPTAMAA
ncbi:MAG: hypothetical protein ABT25_25900 [Variovorax sp. SCN 67-20]|uniref:BapA/Bap/LapF family prefix-like domain-containing protein n=1 Tax=Variovorax sp. SCN 67-20 TaxID=1660153 RepID=UPI00086F8192|nr:BapA prefix-like domain-containing protein [Variovorax sp. SCN 67-20]ODV19840.1 MAG: hypothetical protein ABT25_25900 [Variovorax sp. SCN 67-20]